MPLSEDVRRELARDRRRSGDCDRLAELSGLFHTAGSLHLRGHGEFSRPPRPRRVGGRPPRVRPAARSSASRREIRTYRQRAFDGRDPLPAARARGPSARSAGAARGRRRSRPRTRRSSRRRKRVVGRACCRGAYLRGAFLGGGSVSGPRVAAPRDPERDQRRGGAARLGRAAQEDVPLRVRDRGRHAVAYAKGAEAIADALALAGRERQRARDRRARGRRARRARARTGSRTPTTRTSCARAGRPTRSSGRSGRSRRRAGSNASRRRCARSPSCVSGTRRRRSASSPSKCRPPATKAAAHRRLGRLIRLAEDCSDRCSFAESDTPYLATGGAALVRRWIQTPSAGQVLSAVNRRGRSSSELPLRPACCVCRISRPSCGGLLRGSRAALVRLGEVNRQGD